VPEGIVDIDELGSQMIIATTKNIRFWDFDSASTEIGAKINKEINQIVVYNNLIYIQAGTRGEWYVSNGTTVEPFAKLPETLFNLGTGQISITNLVIKDELIYFGVGGVGISPVGIYSLNPRTRALNLEHTLFTGEDGSSKGITLGGLIESGSGELILAHSELTGEVLSYHAEVISTTRNTSDASFLITQLLTLGGKDNKQTISKIEIQLTKPLVTGDSLKLYRRNAITGSWTQHGDTKTYSASLSQQSFSFPAISDIESIQFKVVLNNTTEYLQMTLY
jgi:hypothetical protein